jgi:quercetin dioxygenase-like cupin family protein
MAQARAIGRSIWMSAWLVVGLMFVRPSEAADAVSETLLKTTKSWDGTSYKAYPSGQPEVTVLRIYIPPHSSLAWHYHPVINAAYVLSGELTVQRRDNGQQQAIHAGQVLPEMVDNAHRGYTGDQSATLIVFYAGASDTSITVPVTVTSAH